MPLIYDPNTGVPRYVPDLGEEITEGVTPPVVKITEGVTPPVVKITGRKIDVFKGDKPLSKARYERLMADDTPLDTSVADKLLADVLGPYKKGRKIVKAGKLDAHVATDGEVDEIEKLAKARTIEHWPLLRRLINRLRRAERK